MSTTGTDLSSRRTAVIIPYYQEEPGILRGAVMSAIAQEGVSDLEIIVVDDGSPAPAREDLKDLDLPSHVTLKLIEQPNRGPGAARNRALDHVSTDTRYVAFLDSDDRWTRNHLSNAIHVLAAGYDLYFSDFCFSSYGESALARGTLDVKRQVCLDDELQIYEYTDDARKALIGSDNYILIPTVVFCYQRFSHLRFQQMFLLGEDITFCMEMVSCAPKIAFCAKIECVSGDGVHIYANSGWDTPKAIWRINELVRWRKWLGRALLDKPGEVDENRTQLRKLRSGFVINLLHELRHKQAFGNKNIVLFLKTDPVAVLYILPVTVRAIIKKMQL